MKSLFERMSEAQRPPAPKMNGHGFGDAKCGIDPRQLKHGIAAADGRTRADAEDKFVPFPPIPEGADMRKDPTVAEIMENEAETEAHDLVLQWSSGRGERYSRETRNIVADFAAWMLLRRAPAGDALNDLAERLTPNPARTPAGTLAVILDGIDRIPDEWLARSLAHVNARQVHGMEVPPLTDEQWKDGDLQAKMRLLGAARSLKEALREASKR